MTNTALEFTGDPNAILEDEDGNVLDWDDLDNKTGYLSQETRITKHHDAVEAVQEISHYYVQAFYFWDADPLIFDSTDNSDSHIKIIDLDQGIFEYVNVEDEGIVRNHKGTDIGRAIDVEKVEARDAYDEQEIYYVWHLYTEEELLAQAQENKKIEKQSNFLENGPDQLDMASSDIEDLAILVSELVGME